MRQSAKCFQLDERLLICNIPGPMPAGTDYRVKIDFGTKRLVGGMASVAWGPVEVYSSSDGTEDMDDDNNRHMSNLN